MTSEASRVAEDADGRPRTSFDEIIVGTSLGSLKWSVSRQDVAGLILSDSEFDPWFESCNDGGSGMIPPLATYPPVRVMFTKVYNIRGVFYQFESEFLRPIPYNCELTISGVVSDKWVKRDREYVKYSAEGVAEDGTVYFRTSRTHALDYLDVKVPKQGRGIDSGIVA
jgi:hypothetical protein